MTTIATAQQGFDAQTTAVLIPSLTHPDLPAGVKVVRPGTDDNTVAAGTLPFIKQQFVFNRASQLQLGNTAAHRVPGMAICSIYVRRRTGNQVRNLLIHLVTEAFRSKRLGGVTYLDVLMPVSAEVGEWNVTGMSIPFYFDAM